MAIISPTNSQQHRPSGHSNCYYPELVYFDPAITAITGGFAAVGILA